MKQAILAWRRTWIAKNRGSHHPSEFWEEVADVLLLTRIELGNNPLVPIGRYMMNWPGAMELVVARNNDAIELERAGRTDKALVLFEAGVADEFFGTNPYDRLRIIYTRRRWFDDAMRVCEAYLALPERPVGQDKEHFRQHLDKLRKKGGQAKGQARMLDTAADVPRKGKSSGAAIAQSKSNRLTAWLLVLVLVVLGVWMLVDWIVVQDSTVEVENSDDGHSDVVPTPTEQEFDIKNTPSDLLIGLGDTLKAEIDGVEVEVTLVAVRDIGEWFNDRIFETEFLMVNTGETRSSFRIEDVFRAVNSSGYRLSRGGAVGLRTQGRMFINAGDTRSVVLEWRTGENYGTIWITVNVPMAEGLQVELEPGDFVYRYDFP